MKQTSSRILLRKMIGDLDKSLKIYRGSRKKVEDGLCAIHQENLDLSKDLSKSLQKGFFVTDGAFESVLKKMGTFTLTFMYLGD